MRFSCSLVLSALLSVSVAAVAAPASSRAPLTVGGTTTYLGATPSTVSPGQSLALTAFVQSNSGGATPTGTVQFLYGSYVLATATLSNGIANYSASSGTLAPGNYSLTAKYSGDTNYAASTSSVEVVTIGRYTTTASLAPPASVREGAVVSFSATVQKTAGPGNPTGTVSLENGSTVLETVPLVNGTATFSANTAGYAAGTYQLSAVYSGDATFAPATSTQQPVTVVGTTVTAVSFGESAYAVGQTATATATVTAPSGGGTPTGTVKFSVGPTALGSAPLVNGVATFTASTAGIPVSNYPVTATYTGSALFQASSGTASVSLDPAYAVTPASVGVAPAGTTQFSLSPVTSGNVTWYVNGIAGGNSSVGTISSSGVYTAPATVSSAITVSITATVTTEPTYLTPAASAYVIPGGTLATTANPQVAAYTINLPAGASVAVNFGQTTAYGLNTWQQAAPAGGGNVTILVAGMIKAVHYHLQGVISLPASGTYHDADQTFLPGGYGPSDYPAITIATNTSPNPGIELLDQVTNHTVPFFATDLDGNVIWGYAPTDATVGTIAQPVKLLPDGNFLVVLSQNSSAPISQAGIPAGSLQVVREVDLTGTTVRQLSLSDLNARLITAGYSNLNILTIHHEITVLPNGHLIVLGNILVNETGLTGFSAPVNVLGDVLIDVDPSNNFAVGWVWNEFDHFDVNRHPYLFPDWTHTNAVIYSADDGNLLVSMRHQNWVVKVRYSDGAGDGTVLWKLGAQGDFTLENSTSLDDWFYAQHYPSFTTSNTTGTFGLAVMDNGDDRGVYTNTQCGTGSNAACYTTAPILQVDETNMTVTKTFVNTLPPSDYSFFGGNAEVLANGDEEYDLCAHVLTNGYGNSAIRETTVGASPQVVWEMDESGENMYRGFRIGSLYPGVTWTPGAGISAALRQAHTIQPGATPKQQPTAPGAPEM